MKKEYTNPIINVEEFIAENILTASGTHGFDPIGDLKIGDFWTQQQ